MIFKETILKDAYIIELERKEDDRGFFARSFCRNEFIKRGLNPDVVQCNISFNEHKGTLRGMHYQIEPHSETKLVRCTMGAIYDVIVDLRPDSSTFKQWAGIDLTVDNHRTLYIPEGMAHGFLTLADNTEVFYQMSEFYYSECARGVRWDDPEFGIQWPPGIQIIAARDQQYPDFIA